MRQTLAVLVTFASFGGGSRLQEIDSLKTTQMLEHVVTPDLVRVTTTGQHRCPAGGEYLFPDQCSLYHPVDAHGRFSLAVWVRRRHSGWGKEGQRSNVKLL